MISLTVQRNIDARPIIIPSAQEPGYHVFEAATQGEADQTHANLHELYVFAKLDRSVDYTIRYFMKAENIMVTPDSNFSDCVIFPCLQANIMLEEHGFYAAYKVTEPQPDQEYHAVPISTPVYSGLTPPEAELPILYFGKE